MMHKHGIMKRGVANIILGIQARPQLHQGPGTTLVAIPGCVVKRGSPAMVAGCQACPQLHQGPQTLFLAHLSSVLKRGIAFVVAGLQVGPQLHQGPQAALLTMRSCPVKRGASATGLQLQAGPKLHQGTQASLLPTGSCTVERGATFDLVKSGQAGSKTYQDPDTFLAVLASRNVEGSGPILVTGLQSALLQVRGCSLQACHTAPSRRRVERSRAIRHIEGPF
mmetsp:Transcript_25360/g.70948  ORF Transcript_25360/g.70948 Transcript_25360/m.70948 type:complete len:223 (+) Transcript_25360:830-1498(+)